MTFVCLASRNATSVPSSKTLLNTAGLGEKKITFKEDADANDLYRKLLLVYPKLEEAGGYELLRVFPNTKKLHQIVVPLMPVHLKEEVGLSRIYIRPLQRDISLDRRDDKVCVL